MTEHPAKTPGTNKEERIMLALVRAAELFKRRSSAIFADYGLSFSQYNLLRVLEESEGGRMSISEVGRLLLASSANMSGITQRLEKGKFIRRLSDPNDDRRKILVSTPKCKRVLADIRAKQEANVQSFLSGFPAEYKRDLHVGLRKMLQTDQPPSS